MAGREWEQLSARQVFAVIWRLFKEECRHKNQDPEDVLEGWEEQTRILEITRKAAARARKRSPQREFDERAWADADRRALANFSKIAT